LTRERFIAALRKIARADGVPLAVNTGRGKGSHYRVSYGSRITTIKSGDLSPTYIRLVLKQLGLPKDAV
jgi:hypothetical protein